MALDAPAPVSLSLDERYAATRALSLELASPLSEADCQLQSMADASPTKWHLAHTSWFFETFILREQVEAYQPFHPRFEYLFNSYYNGVGEQHARPDRGLVSRPSLAEIRDYRAHVDLHVQELLARGVSDSVAAMVELGIQHEQQHQELLLTDILHAFSRNPLLPAYQPGELTAGQMGSLGWVSFDERIHAIGAADAPFSYDNERPQHRALIPACLLGDRLITNSEYQAFIQDGGYDNPALWLSDGWAAVRQHGWRAPLYWNLEAGTEFGLRGEQALQLSAPVTHVSYYEADAFARWAGARLPTEFEWERAAVQQPVVGQFLEAGRLHPAAAVTDGSPLQQVFGDCWEWTQSAYSAYPGFAVADGAVGEYNGKFMANQMVLRGGSCVSSSSHLRASYRNFFYPDARWQFSGIRLAKDA